MLKLSSNQAPSEGDKVEFLTGNPLVKGASSGVVVGRTNTSVAVEHSGSVEVFDVFLFNGKCKKLGEDGLFWSFSRGIENE